MNKFFVLVALAAVGCGGAEKQRKAESQTAYDPELAELCLTEDAPVERSCNRKVSDLGAVRWSFPMGSSDEFKRVKKIFDDNPKEPQLIRLLDNLIRQVDRFKCGGTACDRLWQNTVCEAQMARVIRAKAHLEQGNPTESFRDLSHVVRAGPSHPFYEEIPDFFTELEKDGFSKPMLTVCISRYEWPEAHVVKGRENWKPYTKDDPAPEW